MAKVCGLCGFTSDDVSLFAQHASNAHGLGAQPADTTPAWSIGIPILVVGGFVLYALATLFVAAFCVVSSPLPR